MYNLKFLEGSSLKFVLEEFENKETPPEVINEALKILRGIYWNSEDSSFVIDDDMHSDPRIQRLFLSIHQLNDKKATAQNGGFESIKLLVESHLVHHLWNHIHFTPQRDDRYDPLSSLVFDAEREFKRKRGRRELAERVETCLSSQIRPRDLDQEIKDKWSHFIDFIDGWFNDRESALVQEVTKKSLNFEGRLEEDDSSLTRGEAPKKRARILPPAETDERVEFISSHRGEELLALKGNWLRFKKRIETYPPAELFDNRDEINRERQYLEFACRFATAFSILDESEEGEFCFSSICEFIHKCYHGWDVEITFLENRASNETTFTDPVLRAWQISRDVRRGLVSEAVLKVFRGLSSVNRHYQSSMERAMNRPFWLGYSKENLSRFEAANFILCRQNGERVFKAILDEKLAVTIREILKDEYIKMSTQERESIFEEVLDCYIECIKANSDLLLEPMKEEERLMSSLKNCKERRQICDIYEQLNNLDVITPYLRYSPTVEKTDEKIVEEANKFAETFLTIQATKNRRFLKTRLVEDEIFGAACWAALAKVLSINIGPRDHSQGAMIIRWIISLPFLPKQKDLIIETLKLKEDDLGQGLWGHGFREALEARDLCAIATMAKDVPAVYYSFPEVIALGSEEEALRWLERNPPSTLSVDELRETISEVVIRGFSLVLEVLTVDPRVGRLAWGGIIYLLEKAGEFAKVDEKISQEDGGDVFKNCVELFIKTKGALIRLINLMERRMSIPKEESFRTLKLSDFEGISSLFGRLIFESEVKNYCGVGRYLLQCLTPELQSKSWALAARRMIENDRADLLEEIPINLFLKNDLLFLIRLPGVKTKIVVLRMLLSKLASHDSAIKGVISYYLHEIKDSNAISDSILKNLPSSVHFFSEAVFNKNEALLDQLACSADLFKNIETYLNSGLNQISKNKLELLVDFSNIGNKRISFLAKGVLFYFKIKGISVEFDLSAQKCIGTIIHESLLIAIRHNDLKGVESLLAYRESLGLASSKLITYLSTAIDEKRLSVDDDQIDYLIGLLYYKEDKAGGNTVWVYRSNSGKIYRSTSGILNKRNKRYYWYALLGSVSHNDKLMLEKYLSKMELPYGCFSEMVALAANHGSLSVLQFLLQSTNRQSNDIQGAILYCQSMSSGFVNQVFGKEVNDLNSSIPSSGNDPQNSEPSLLMTAVCQDPSQGAPILDLALMVDEEDYRPVVAKTDEISQLQETTFEDSQIPISALKLAIRFDNVAVIKKLLSSFSFSFKELGYRIFNEFEIRGFNNSIGEILKRADAVEILRHTFGLIQPDIKFKTFFKLMNKISHNLIHEISSIEVRDLAEKGTSYENYQLLIYLLLNNFQTIDETLVEIDRVEISNDEREMIFEKLFKTLISFPYNKLSDLNIQNMKKIIDKFQLSNHTVDQLIQIATENERGYISVLEGKKK